MPSFDSNIRFVYFSTKGARTLVYFQTRYFLFFTPCDKKAQLNGSFVGKNRKAKWRSENQNVKNGNGKVKNKNRILNRKAKWRSESQNVKNENGKVKNKNRNLNRKAKWRGENQKVKNKNGKVKNETKSVCVLLGLP